MENQAIAAQKAQVVGQNLQFPQGNKGLLPQGQVIGGQGASNIA